MTKSFAKPNSKEADSPPLNLAAWKRVCELKLCSLRPFTGLFVTLGYAVRNDGEYSPAAETLEQYGFLRTGT
jgi:hypothetical protein